MILKPKVKRKSQKQEKSVAKLIGGKTTVASGAKWFNKADVRNEEFLVECKTTEKNFYSLNANIWEKIEDEAIRDHMRTPLLMIDLEDCERYVVFSPKYFDTTVIANERIRDRMCFKTFTISGLEFESLKSEGRYLAISFTICGKRENKLVCMPIKEFLYDIRGGSDE